jgi:hypothetical protein
MCRKRQEEIDAAIARHAPQETLYDQPFVDRKRTRVTGPFTVEAVPAPAVKSVDEILEPKPEPADASIARSGETLRQGEWRDELLRTGIRGKAGQHIRFARLEPLPGCRWLHADGEEAVDSGKGIVDSKDESGGEKLSTSHNPLSTNRVVVSFGPEHAPLEQRQVAQAIEEAQKLVPKPKIIVFAAFQFDPEAAKDIDETNWPGVTLLKAQMNANLLTDDLKKKRASNESFWLIGQPDVQVECIAEGADKGSCVFRCMALTTTTPRPAASSQAARTGLPSGCSIPTTTAAASTRARSFSPWQARTKVGRNWLVISRRRLTRSGSRPTGARCRCPSRRGNTSGSQSRSWTTGGSRA